MFKKLAIAGMLVGSLAVSAAASAANTWQFSYVGFLDEENWIFAQDYTISGSFTGNDGNNDGVIELGEITQFVLNGTDYLACASGSPFNYCGTDRFRYELGGALDFSAGTAMSDPEGYHGGGYVVRAGIEEYSYRNTPYSHTRSGAYLWTEDTKFSIRSMSSGGVTPAVPEPGTWVMILTGLALVGGVARRRKSEPLQPCQR
ncbi:PEPxxWA-CTERM sorting domain-containing protein [Pseudoduganella chitinolytica]|uniref:PEPxxWA-CTERM sorting domain-containing protein n=1 Tax=Pseudoduganella chitinolytica TaxID=34070 RepID=A0ABY8B569_9BURK|nr:PEPxxWA-CTERM sorting domain-containing protein [Pseudoduganella chitinolytica]WEF31095.1 PEPxxWA-CTERM sorting domain-containing protein [Pseudoduganella chitinolytica]